MAKLLVSVRSKVEALSALAGGATIIDVKEPLNGSLGRAPFDVWREVREVAPKTVPVSVALGELADWMGVDAVKIPPGLWTGLAYCKLGLSFAPPNWIDLWRELRQRLAESGSGFPVWVAVAYIDWQAARAPAPDDVIDAAAKIDECRGVLFDTWNKAPGSRTSFTWKLAVEHARDSGRFVALAGSLDVEAIRRLAPLAPDIFAVRGAACAGGDRFAPIDAERVALLVRAAENRVS